MTVSIYLDRVVAESGEIHAESRAPDYGKILNRLFQKRPYSVRSEANPKVIEPPRVPTSADRILLTPGKQFRLFTPVQQLSDSPLFCGVAAADRDEGGFENTDVFLEIANRTGPGLHFVRATEMRNIAIVDRYAENGAPEIVRFSGSESGTVLTINCGSYMVDSVVVVCEQPDIRLRDSSFTGEGTVLEARGGCRKVVYHSNLNHSDARAVKITSPACQIDMQCNTIDIGSQLLWQSGQVLSGSVIAYNSCHNHRPNMDSLPGAGHFVYIDGGVSGLEIVNNVFSGADGIDGDRSNPLQVDECQFDRPVTHIAIKAPEGSKVTNLKISRNQFRFPRNESIVLTGPIENCAITYNNFSGIDSPAPEMAGQGCLLRGDSVITNSSFSFNMIESKDGRTVNLFNFSNRTLDNCKVRGNFVCSAGETFVGIGALAGGSIAKRNFERDD